jgi:hypothetical protein
VEIWGATRQIGLTTFGSQERDPTEQVQRSFFRSLLGVRASTSGVSILGEFGSLRCRRKLGLLHLLALTAAFGCELLGGQKPGKEEH